MKSPAESVSAGPVPHAVRPGGMLSACANRRPRECLMLGHPNSPVNSGNTSSDRQIVNERGSAMGRVATMPHPLSTGAFVISEAERSAAEGHSGMGAALGTLEDRTPVDLVRLYPLEDYPLTARTGIVAMPVALDAGQRGGRDDRRRGPRRLNCLEGDHRASRFIPDHYHP